MSIYKSQENCLAVIEDNHKHNRTRRLYHKQLSSEQPASFSSTRTSKTGRRQGFRHQDGDVIERLSNISAISSSTTSDQSKRSKNLLYRMKQRRDNATKIKSTRNLGVKSKSSRSMSKVQEEDDEEEVPKASVTPIDQHQNPYGYPPPGMHPGMHPGMLPGMYPGMHPGYYMPPPMPQPVQPQIIIQQPPGGWGGYPPPQLEARSSGFNQQQYIDQQLINQQQQDIIRQQQQLQELQQEQLRKQHEDMLKYQVKNPPSESVPKRKSFSRRDSDPPQPPPRSRSNSDVDDMSNPALSNEFLDQFKMKMDIKGDKYTQTEDRIKSKPRVRTDTTGSESAASVKSSTPSARNTDDFTVGILGIGDLTVLEKTIGLLKRNSFSDKFRNGEEPIEPAKPRGGMHGSFVGKTKEDLTKRPSHKTSQVLTKAAARLESRESLELDFNDVYNVKKPPSFATQSGLADKAATKTFRRQDSSGRNFAFENPHFSH